MGTKYPPGLVEEMAKTWESGNTTDQIAQQFSVPRGSVMWLLKGRISPRRKGTPPDLGRRRLNDDGYVIVTLPYEEEQFREMCFTKNGRRQRYLFEHRLVMARSLGRPLAKHETVHHKNGSRQDNRIENLELRVGQHGKGNSEAHCATCTCFVDT